MLKKKKNYYKPNSDGISKSSSHPVFIVRWLKDNEQMNDGPYDTEERAEDRCVQLLKSGICSWLVRYHG